MNRNREQHPARRRFRVGPGLLVTAAFIGPGTVVTASKAGAEFGCGLLWTVLFACVGTVILQSLAARLGIVTGQGLGEAIRRSFSNSVFLRPAVALVIGAIGIGNAAYQTGNLTGAVKGISVVTGGDSHVWVIALAGLTIALILLGRYRVLHRVLVGLVALLSLSFLWSAANALPSAGRLLQGLVVPRVGADHLTLVLGMIGTTIVPYNLFLHASGAAAAWRGEDFERAWHQCRWDTLLSIGLGGLVTASILLTASAAFFDTGTPWTGIDQIADQLRPTLGAGSGPAFAIGLFAAGLTSSITAPLATAYAVCGCLGWDARPSQRRFQTIAIAVVLIGAASALRWGSSPASTILFAQVANGLLLPMIAVFLLVAVRKASASGQANLSLAGYVAAWIVVAGVALLGVWRIVGALG
ncbi:divalent metal cation transporter [Roseiconus nitratireducens]|uniref:Divalent metal cation transporter n=1 Tax=Roseiconus nitratireducens TaxID=2605748 RepID=A0A5M6D1R2_9BACT|nr:Nramp family divalent metal transporter [Roseiconus nitratireducens]KAA5539589.1 divalent metal cation transporter [Roseiconus nitratireducens]